MSIPLNINGETYNYPETGDTDWGSDATDWAEAVTVGTLQKAGGLFQLLDEVDFGTAFGVKSLYYKTRSSNIATIGQFRLANDDLICWRNNANDGDLSLTVDAADALNFNGTSITVGGDPVQVAITPVDTATIDLTLDGSNNLSADINTDSIDNSMIASAAAIAYSKLDLADGIVNADINTSAAIAYSKLSLTSSIVNADISASAAIAYSKLNLTGGIVNADVNTSAAIAYSKLSLSNSIVNADISSSAAIAYSKLNLASSIVDADLSASAAISFSKLAALSSGNILIGSATNVATSVAMSGDIIINDAGVTSYNNNVPLNRGGTNAALTANAGGVLYSGASSFAVSSPGTAGQVLISGGSGAPTFGGAIAASARVNSSTSTTSLSTSGGILDYNVIDYDPLNLITGEGSSSWRFTVPAGQGGFYMVSASAHNSTTATRAVFAEVIKNASTVVGRIFQNGLSTGVIGMGAGSLGCELAPTDYLWIKIYSLGGTDTLNTDVNLNHISIWKVR